MPDNDVRQGCDGDDLQCGGRGRHVLTGDADFDTFAMIRLGDSGTSNATRDVISDFVTRSDLVDLSPLDAKQGGNDDAFTFIGSAAFSSVAGQLRLRVNGAKVIVEGDVNGDAVADFAISVSKMAVIIASDFVL